MSKPNRVTIKTIKQGQTIFFVSHNFDKGQKAKRTVESIFVHSQKTKLPPQNCVVEKYPVSLIRDWLESSPGRGPSVVFHSRKRAAKFLTDLELFLKNNR